VAQPGFDEAYPLGAVMGLRVGYILGVLEGLSNALNPPKEEAQMKNTGEGDVKREEDIDQRRSKKMLAQARQELTIENLCGSEYWRSDGSWAYDVRGKAAGEKGEEEENVTFWDVADQHPVVRKWLGKVRDEVQRLGIGDTAEEGFSGVGEGGGARLEDLS
ncbi:MAG: hypothetical protein Q9168_008432, partial [Polycauliona sp. 1 TL-2023]